MAPLTPQQVAFYDSEGYLVIEDFASSEECQSLMGRMKVLLDGFDPSHRTVFSTKTKKHTLDDYFLKSADSISFFFEENAFGDDGNLKQAKELSINKVGHALHEKDTEFKKFSESSKVADVLMSLNYKRPILIQSMYIFKQPGIGGEVRPHQDSTYLYTDPPSAIGLWVALEDATKENGCMWALPKSHKGPLKRKAGEESKEYNYSEFVPLEVRAGTLIVLHGTLVHQSFENKSSKSRHAYTLHAFESDGSVWSPDNWLQRREFPQPLYAQ